MPPIKHRLTVNANYNIETSLEIRTEHAIIYLASVTDVKGYLNICYILKMHNLTAVYENINIRSWLKINYVGLTQLKSSQYTVSPVLSVILSAWTQSYKIFVTTWRNWWTLNDLGGSFKKQKYRKNVDAEKTKKSSRSFQNCTNIRKWAQPSLTLLTAWSPPYCSSMSRFLCKKEWWAKMFEKRQRRWKVAPWSCSFAVCPEEDALGRKRGVFVRSDCVGDNEVSVLVTRLWSDAL